MAFRLSIASRRKNVVTDDGDRRVENFRMRFAHLLRLGPQAGTWVGRLDSKSKLRIVWKLLFGPRGQVHEIMCTVSRKSKKREVFLDGDLIHSGALGLLESVGGVASDTTLFEHQWELAGRAFCVSERVFVREGLRLCSAESEDPSVAAATREAARFELSIDGKLFQDHPEFELLSPSDKEVLEASFQRTLASKSVDTTDRVQQRAVKFTQHSEEALALPGACSSSEGQSTSRRGEELLSTKARAGSKSVRRTTLDSNSVMSDFASMPPWLSRFAIAGTAGVAYNGLAARIHCSLGPGVLGGKVTVKNDDSGMRVEIKTASREARECGVCPGDVLLALNGRALPPNLDANELMSLLRANPRYMVSEVVASLWRRRRDDVHGSCVTVRLNVAQPPLIELARLDQIEGVLPADVGWAVTNRVPERLSHANLDTVQMHGDPDCSLVASLKGHYIVVRADGNDWEPIVHEGDVMIGLDHEPMPRFATSTTLAQLARNWALNGNKYFNLWRLADSAKAATIAAHARVSERSVVIAPSGKVVTVSTSSTSSSCHSTARTPVTVTGDGGRVEIASIPDYGQTHKPSNVVTRNATAEADSHSARSDDDIAQRCESSVENSVHKSHVLLMATSGMPPTELSAEATNEIRRKQRNVSVEIPLARESAIADDQNFAVFKRLLQSGATLDEIIAEMRLAGVPKETTKRIIESLRAVVAERAGKIQKSEDLAASASSLVTTSTTSLIDHRKAMLTGIVSRRKHVALEREADAEAATRNDSSFRTPDSVADIARAKFDATLARYRKMVKLGVPAASVRQRMRLDQVEASAVRVFGAENGLDDDEHEADDRKSATGKRAKLHWDAVTLDDRALAVSVWAADVFGEDMDREAVGRETGAASAVNGSQGLLGEDDLERLATLFSDVDRSSLSTKPDEASKANGDNFVPTINGCPVTNARLFEAQRSQNVSITIAPLVRAYDGADSLACAIARMDTPRISLEQLETLRAAMPTDVEKSLVAAHINAAATCKSANELSVLDTAISRDARFSVETYPESVRVNTCEVCGKKGQAYGEKSTVVEHIRSQGDSILMLASIHQQCLRRDFVAENLAPAERFAYAVTCVERALSLLRAPHSPSADEQSIDTQAVSLSRRLQALVAGLSAESATKALAETADNYAKASRLLLASRDLAKLLKHVLAAGNAVNAGSSKAGASALRLSSLLQAARTKGVDGKTTLLDGVVGLLLDRTARKLRKLEQQQERSKSYAINAINVQGTDNSNNRHDGLSPRHRISSSFVDSLNREDVFLKDDLLDFPENDGLLVSLDAVRGADEKALLQEATKLAGNLNVLTSETKVALLEFGSHLSAEQHCTLGSRSCVSCTREESLHVLNEEAGVSTALFKYLLPYGSSTQGRLIEHDRLVQLETNALVCVESLHNEHIKPLGIAVSELRMYFACDVTETLDSIFATLRDFLRAFCDSRDVQRRQRRAEKREADRRSARLADKFKFNCSSEPSKLHEPSCARKLSNHAYSHDSAMGPLRRTPNPPKWSPPIPTQEMAKPPLEPLPQNGVDAMVAKARRHRSIVESEDNDLHSDAEWVDEGCS